MNLTRSRTKASYLFRRGPVALILAFVVASRGRLDLHGTFRNTGWLCVLSTAMSSLAFWLYVALLRKGEALMDLMLTRCVSGQWVDAVNRTSRFQEHPEGRRRYRGEN